MHVHFLYIDTINKCTVSLKYLNTVSGFISRQINVSENRSGNQE